MVLIFESNNFLVQSSEHPFISRNDGGLITIDSKVSVSIRKYGSANHSGINFKIIPPSTPIYI